MDRIAGRDFDKLQKQKMGFNKKLKDAAFLANYFSKKGQTQYFLDNDLFTVYFKYIQNEVDVIAACGWILLNDSKDLNGTRGILRKTGFGIRFLIPRLNKCFLITR
jgi:hypothetical protein